VIAIFNVGLYEVASRRSGTIIGELAFVDGE
jgi:hypothetical protein